VSRVGNFTNKLYRGEVSYDIVGRTKLWYAISAVILLLAILGLTVRGLNLGIEFRGGAEFITPSPTCTVEQVRDTAGKVGAKNAITQQVGSDRIRLQTETLSAAQSEQMVAELATTCGTKAEDIKVQLVGATWGSEITKKALTGLVVFLIAVVIFLSIYFEWRMAAAAMVALIHDVVITVGIYALVGFEVTPATVIGVLTILGFSLYDTVVVFDKVKENTQGITGQSRYTFSELANLALNQTIIRSINTSIVALLPVASILFVGAGLLGAGTLKDLALVLFVGTAVGTYSSIFVATPALCDMKEREPAMKALSQRVMKRRASRGEAVTGDQPAEKAAVAAGGGGGLAPAADRKHRQNRDAAGRAQPKRQSRSQRKKS